MKLYEAPLPGLMVIEPKMFNDSRGYFFEPFQQFRYAKAGIPSFVQDNFSHSKHNVIRGLHYQQLPKAQGKLVWVMRGAAWDVVVDIRLKSKTFGRWFNIILTAENHLQLYIPPGFAHGFCALSDEVDFCYKCTDVYAPDNECGIAWNDPKLNIPWPVTTPILSPKDEVFPCLHEIKHENLFP